MWNFRWKLDQFSDHGERSNRGKRHRRSKFLWTRISVKARQFHSKLLNPFERYRMRSCLAPTERCRRGRIRARREHCCRVRRQAKFKAHSDGVLLTSQAETYLCAVWSDKGTGNHCRRPRHSPRLALMANGSFACQGRVHHHDGCIRRARKVRFRDPFTLTCETAARMIRYLQSKTVCEREGQTSWN